MRYRFINKDGLLESITKTATNPKVLPEDYRMLMILYDMIESLDAMVITTDDDGAILDFSEQGRLDFKWHITGERINEENEGLNEILMELAAAMKADKENL